MSLRYDLDMSNSNCCTPVSPEWINRHVCYARNLPNVGVASLVAHVAEGDMAIVHH